MRFPSPRRFVRASLTRQLVLGAVMVQVALMSLFIADLVFRERETLNAGRLARAEGIATMLATSSVSWTLSDDTVGLSELATSATAFEGLRYAIILNPAGRVLAHSDPGMAGQIVADPVGRSLIDGDPTPRVVKQTYGSIDFAAPITTRSDGRLVGWAWVSLSRDDVNQAVTLAAFKGVLYVLFITLLATAIIWLMARNMTRSLANLAEVAKKFQAGERGVRADASRPDEIGTVALGLNEMLDAVTSSEQAILRREEALSQVQRVARLGGFRRMFAAPHGEWSKETYALFGLPERSAPPGPQEVLERIHPDDRERVAAALGDRTEDVKTLQFTIVPPGLPSRVCWAELRLIRIDGEPVGYQGVCQDVTAREDAAAQLRQAQKMESVGQLTGGLAHDFNNLLSVIVGNLEFIQEAVPADSPASDYSKTAMLAAEKGATLTQQLLAFSRRQPLAPQAFDISAQIENLASMVLRTIGPGVAMELSSNLRGWEAVADPSQVESAVLNMILNAKDAMPGGGRIRISVAHYPGDGPVPEPCPELAAGDYVAVSVADEGTGVAAENIDRIFEPFFTTKGVGKGSGLGLSMIHGFAKQSGGDVTVSSEVGQGAVFTLYLPAAAARSQAPTATLAPAAASSSQETVIIVEDDDDVRRIAARNIAGLGYKVLEAASPAEALSLLGTRSDIDLMFTDIAMPGAMDGLELGQRAKALNPSLRVLYTSGFAPAKVKVAHEDPGASFLQKPYRKAALAKRLREVLDPA